MEVPNGVTAGVAATKPMSVTGWFLLTGGIVLFPTLHALDASALWRIFFAAARVLIEVALVINGARS